MKYAVRMGSSAKIYVPSSINIGPGIHNFMKRDAQADSMEIA
jgi:hypothetical protein